MLGNNLQSNGRQSADGTVHTPSMANVLYVSCISSSRVYIKANVTVHSSIYVLLIYSASVSFSIAGNAVKQKRKRKKKALYGIRTKLYNIDFLIPI